MKKIITMIVLAFVLATSIGVMAHSGGTDRNGCHCDRRNGGCDYHCH